MKFRAMSLEMKESEIELILHPIYPYGTAHQIIRNKKVNSIKVLYSTLEEPGNVLHEIIFLPDDIYIVDDHNTLNEELFDDLEKLHQYRKFMLAKGYSEMWLNNPYVEIES